MAPNADADTAARSMITTRMIDAPRDLVFEAWTRPEHFAHWWGPDGFTTSTHAFAFHPGGVWRFVMHGPDGRDYQNRIVFDEIARPERLVYRHPGGADVEPVEIEVTVTFEDVGGRTRLTMCHLFTTQAERDRVVREYGAAEGGRQTLGRLDAYIAEIGGQPGAKAEGTFTRLYDAPRDLVFAAWTDPKHLARWWGPHGFTNPVCEFDARPGGAIRIDMTGPDGTVYPMTGTVHEVAAPARLVFTAVARDRNGNPQLESRTIVTLTEEHGGTRVTVEVRAFAIAPAGIGYLKGMNEGWNQNLERLETYLASGAAR